MNRLHERCSWICPNAWQVTVGIVANQPMVLAGALDIDSSNKAADHPIL